MALQGTAFLALWNDFEPARDDEYNAWHTFEHVPERVGIEGILAGRRYVARERDEDRYFTLYELDSLSVLAGPQYADVVDRPTEWTRSMRPSFRNFRRFPCATLFTSGMGIGGSIATFRVGVAQMSAEMLASASSVLKSFLDRPGITSIHAGVSGDPNGGAVARDTATGRSTAFPWTNAPPGDDGEAVAHYVLLVEALQGADLDTLGEDIMSAVARTLAPRTRIAMKTFRLEFRIERAQLQHPTSTRQPPRPELRERWR